MSILLPEPASAETPAPPRPPRGPWLGRRARRWLGGSFGLVVLLGVVWLGGIRFVNSERVKAPLRDRLRRELNQRSNLVELGDELRIDWAGRVRLGPIRLKGTPDGVPFLEIPSIRVRPSYRNLLIGRVVPAAITLENPTLRLGRRAEAIRAFVDDLRKDRPAPPPSAGRPAAGREPRPTTVSVHAEGLRLSAGAQDGVPVSGPIDASIMVTEDDAGDLHASGKIRFPDGGRGRIAVDEVTGHFTVDAALTGLTPAAVEPALWKALPVRAERGTFEAHFHLEAADILTPAKASLRVSARDAAVSGKRLAPRPVGPASFGAEVAVAWQPKDRAVVLQPSRVWLGAQDTVFASFGGKVIFGKGRAFEFESKIDAVPFEALVSALPPQVRPDESAPSARGPLRASFSIKGPIDAPESWEVKPVLDLKGLQPVHRGRNLLAAFEHTAVDAQGRTRTVLIDPEAPLFVPLEELPEYVVRAVLLSEDAGFFGHAGFEFTEIHDSLIAAVRGTRFRGASTLTQQLAKNLFLSREKTLVRKVEEALITLALEVSVPKERLLEIYLNLIEWGPNLYGLREAARHYFGVEPTALSPKQAAFLATIIPNPNRYYGYYLKGQLTPLWEERVKALLLKLRDAGYLDEGTYLASVAEPLVFHKASPAGAPAH